MITMNKRFAANDCLKVRSVDEWAGLGSHCLIKSDIQQINCDRSTLLEHFIMQPWINTQSGTWKKHETPAYGLRVLCTAFVEGGLGLTFCQNRFAFWKNKLIWIVISTKEYALRVYSHGPRRLCKICMAGVAHVESSWPTRAKQFHAKSFRLDCW